MAVNGVVVSDQNMSNTNTTPELGQAGVVNRSVTITPTQNVNDLYNNYINQFSNTNPSTANLLRTSYNDYGAFTESANNINNLYNNMYSSTDPYYQNFARINQNLDQDIVGRLNDQLQTAYSQYGPQGAQTKRVEDYYRNMANTIAAQNAVNTGNISAQAAASGANTGAQRNAISQAQINANQEYLKLKEAEIKNYDNLYQNLNQYIDNFVKTYANSKNQYVRDAYNQLLQYKQGIEQARANSLISLEGSRLQQQLQEQAAARARASSGGNQPITAVGTDQLGRQYFIDANGRAQFLTPEQSTAYNSYRSSQPNNLLSNASTTPLQTIQNAITNLRNR